MSDDDNIVNLSDRKPKPLSFRQEVKPLCFHQRLAYCHQDRTVRCDVCGATLDPFTVLCEFADRLVNAELFAKQLRREADELDERIKKLKKIESAVKLRLKRSGAPVVSRGWSSATAVPVGDRVVVSLDDAEACDVSWAKARDLGVAICEAAQTAAARRR